jgi:hypothetical protein
MTDVTPDKAEVAIEKGPNQGTTKLAVTIKKETDSLQFSKDTLMYVLYLLFKANIIGRNNLKQIFRTVDKDMPKDVVKYLLEEAAKA